ncbi:MAG TPA: FtsW/RodA/SpoVE family cell cycle protein [Candidatus Paceibacterota bacterium]|nr:FtsW/RodA/SpoVE family cell cycle protein [Candidatus Paceibacterota bacterium]
MAFSKRLNLSLMLPVILLVAFSLLTLASLSANDEPAFQIFKKQVVWFLLGLGVFFLLSSFFDYRLLYAQNFFSVAFYLFCLFLMALVLFLGVKVRGAAGWLGFSFFSVQPVELAKLALIILLAKYFAIWHIEIWRPLRLIVPALYAGFYVLLCFLQPDLGSAILLILIWLGMLIVSGLKFKHFLILLLIGLLVAGIGWSYLLQPYQKDRISSFFNPTSDPLGAGYNVIQAKIAIGSGGFWGRGLGQGVETQLRFLPEAKTDFFLAAFVEEWGFFGAFLLFLVLAWFIFELMKIGLRAPDNFSRLFVFGYLILFASQTIINFGANLGFLPVTGLPLPFLSYGGSNLLMNFIALGVIQSIKLRSV